VNSVDDITPVQKKALRKTIDVLREKAPSLFSGLNVAQYRALRSMYTLDKDGNPPSLNIISFANGVGKSHLLILDLIGWTMGPEYLDHECYPVEALAWYCRVKPLRDAGKLSLRLTCVAADMKEGGSVLTLLSELFPAAKPTAKNQVGVYTQIDIKHPDIPGIVNHVAVKTFDQSLVNHSGSTCNRVFINEPPPQEILGETIGRIRSKAGGLPGSLAMFGTIVTEAAWIDNLDDESTRISRCRGHIYENCIGEEVTDSMAAEVRRSIGVTLKKNESGRGYITSGILSKAIVDDMVRYWRMISPNELDARMSGAPVSSGGKIYPNFRRDVHVTDKYEIDPSLPVVMIADPHSARPTLVAWATVTSHDRLVIFDEWPSSNPGPYYETLSERYYTIPQECEIWDRMEQGYRIKNSIAARVGDPNRFRDPDPYTGENLASKYAKHGFDFNTDVVDNVEVGHANVSEYLYFDEGRLAANKDDPSALPRLTIHSRCVNIIRALENYAFKRGRRVDSTVTENINQKFKDGADIVRYLVMWHGRNTYEKCNDKAKVTSSDYTKYCKGRQPAMYRDALFGVNFKKRGAIA